MHNAQAISRAERLFARNAKQEKMRIEGAEATADYRRKQALELAKTERLRALRLERDRKGKPKAA